MSSERRSGDLFVVSAPSGTGKTTLIQKLSECDWPHGSAPEFSVSHTTRAPRPGEVDGRHYHFVDAATFDAMIEDNAFLEWAIVHGERKGTATEEVRRRLEAGVDVLLDIDVQGAANVLDIHPEACAIFILPPSYGELARRIAARGYDEPRTIARRLAVSRWEIERYAIYDYVIINDDLERASRELASIIIARRSRRECRERDVARILEDYQASLESEAPDGAGDSLGDP